MIDGDFFESLADVSFGDMYKNPRHPSISEINKIEKEFPIVYISTDRTLFLFNEIKKLNYDVDVILHNSVVSPNNEIKKILPKQVRKLWCQNFNGIPDERVQPLPVGLERKRWFPKEKKQEQIEKFSKQEVEKDISIYMNFNTDTHPSRKQWYEYFKDIAYTEMVGNGGDFKHYLSMLKRSEFILSPVGRGIDCHRNWECLYLGVIPVLPYNNFNDYMFSDMDTIIIDSLNTDFLNHKIIKSDTIHPKLTQEYWKNKILNI